MKEWSLTKLLESLHDDIQHSLETARKTMGHSGAKGDTSEKIWIKLLNQYLPERYRVDKAFIVDSNGLFSDQIDVVIFDRQYTPFIFHYEDQNIIPAESVYAVFEAKQTMNAEYIKYAQKKVASVRKLLRTSKPIYHIDGKSKPKIPQHIYGGILALESDWNPAFGQPLSVALDEDREYGCLDFGCVAAHGYFYLNNEGDYEKHIGGKPATSFLFKLISQLQISATVPSIDVLAYSKWLTIKQEKNENT